MFGSPCPRVGAGCCRSAELCGDSGGGAAVFAHGDAVVVAVGVGPAGLGDVLILEDGTVVSLLDSNRVVLGAGAAAAAGRAGDQFQFPWSGQLLTKLGRCRCRACGFR